MRFGDVQLQNGDTLLMVAKPSFLKHNHTGDFSVISQVGYQPIKPDPFRLLMAPLFTIIFIVLSAVPYTDVFTAALCCVFAMHVIGCYNFKRMSQAAMMEIYVLVAASFALAAALSVTGVAQALGDSFVYICKWAGNFGVIFGVFLATVTINITLNNDAAAATMVPVCLSIAKTYNIPIKTLAYCVMFAGSNDFCTPIGYQVNTMVWGPGGYRFLDYTWFGIPFQILLLFVTPSLIYGIWGSPDAFASGLPPLVNATLPS
jgi:di/tricarboxylate transporter